MLINYQFNNFICRVYNVDMVDFFKKKINKFDKHNF